MSRSDAEEKVNQGHRKPYAKMTKYQRHRLRKAIKDGATAAEAKLQQHVQ